MNARNSRRLNPLAILGITALLVASTARAAQPATYGTSADSIHLIMSSAFRPYNGADCWTSQGDMLASCGGSTEFVAPLDLPTGAFFDGITMEGCDVLSTADMVAGIVQCVNDSGGYGNCGVVVSTHTSGSGAANCNIWGAPDTGAMFTIDNVNNSYYVFVTTGDTSAAEYFRDVRIYSKLQVSPAPATASFVDVPTTSPIFKFVEALKASGITTGCDATHFCPNDSLTRGQMAVFLASALGLQWQ